LCALGEVRVGTVENNDFGRRCGPVLWLEGDQEVIQFCSTRLMGGLLNVTQVIFPSVLKESVPYQAGAGTSAMTVAAVMGRTPTHAAAILVIDYSLVGCGGFLRFNGWRDNSR